MRNSSSVNEDAVERRLAMKRAILTLIALGVLLPLAAEVAQAGGRQRRDKHEKKRILPMPGPLGPLGLLIAHQHDKHVKHARQVGHRSHRSHRDHRGRGSIGITFRFGHPIRRTCTRWVPGHHVIEERHVRQADRYEQVWVPDRHEVRRDARGRPYRILIEEGHYVNRLIRGEVIIERVKVWVPGHWERI